MYLDKIIPFMHKIYMNFLSGQTILTDCLKEVELEIWDNLNVLWVILSKTHKFFSQPQFTIEEKIDAANNCKQFTKLFPVMFPEGKITRKMHVFSLFFPELMMKTGSHGMDPLFSKLSYFSILDQFR